KPGSAPFERLGSRLLWLLGLGAFGLAWSITTVAAYLPPLLQEFTGSTALIGAILAAEGIFAIFVPLLVGPMSDATATPLGRRRPFLLLALGPMAVTLALLPFLGSLLGIAAVLFAFFFAYYVYEPPYRGLYPDCLPRDVFGRSQGVQHLYRGAALGSALVGGGFLLHVWEPFPFVLAALVTLCACGAVIVFVKEPPRPASRVPPLRTLVATPLRIARRDKNVRRFLIANSAWEATFAGMRTFVVLYVIVGLGQPLYVSSVVLACVAGGYLVAAAVATRFGDLFGLGAVILGASVVYGCGLVGGGFATEWRWWYCGVIFVVAIAAGTVMTLAWGLLFKVMPPGDKGAVSGLALMTKGVGLLVGPPLVGLAVDLSRSWLEATDGYAIVWPAVAIPILAVLPLVTRLAEEERLRDTERRAAT
ncbi:MAG TPA: MFS transporter, partial [Gaiellaceae bacterium]|nr:MFS transporter [Gaiellaceae bacterium]